MTSRRGLAERMGHAPLNSLSQFLVLCLSRALTHTYVPYKTPTAPSHTGLRTKLSLGHTHSHSQPEAPTVSNNYTETQSRFLSCTILHKNALLCELVLISVIICALLTTALSWQVLATEPSVVDTQKPQKHKPCCCTTANMP